MQETTAGELIESYDAFLIDAYGVLVNTSGAVKGAREFIQRLVESGKPFLVLTNDASRSPETAAARYSRFGVPLVPEQILTSGSLLRDHFRREMLVGQRCIVLGTADSERYVREAGGVIAPSHDDSASIVVVCDDDGYPLLETVNDLLSVLFRRIKRGSPTRLILPNPDLIYPSGPESVGITSGAIAKLIEDCVAAFFPGEGRFEALGKPHPAIYEAALGRLNSVERARVVMLGDQLATDIRGARDVGIDSALVMTGLTRQEDLIASSLLPNYVVQNLQLG